MVVVSTISRAIIGTMQWCHGRESQGTTQTERSVGDRRGARRRRRQYGEQNTQRNGNEERQTDPFAGHALKNLGPPQGEDGSGYKEDVGGEIEVDESHNGR
jgi:hypothetical protein